VTLCICDCIILCGLLKSTASIPAFGQLPTFPWFSSDD